MRHYLKYVLALVAWTLSLGVFSQEIDPCDTMRVRIQEDVVVSANRQEGSRKNAVVLVSKTSAETMNQLHAVCLAQGLQYTTGLRVESNCQNCGFMQVRINGLDGHYSQILIDSRPVFSSLTGVYGLEQIVPEMIDRIEIVRGGGSALYGASAVGGTINIITKEARSNSASIGHSLLSIGGSKALDNVTSMTASVVSPNKRGGVYIYAQNRHRNAYDHNQDGYSDIPLLKNLNVGFNSYWKPTDNTKLTLQYNYINDLHRGGNKIDIQPHEANIAETAKHSIHHAHMNFLGQWGQHRFEAYAAIQDNHRNSYNGGIGHGSEEELEDALKAYGYTHGLTLTTGALYSFAFQKPTILKPSLTVGAEYSYDFLSDSIPGYATQMLQRVHIFGAYIQNEWKNEQWTVLLGGRVDKHSLIQKPIFSPRLNIRYKPIQDVTLRIGYAGGFRAPQSYDEDLHVAIVEGERISHILAKNLKEERSHSVNLSAGYDHHWNYVGFEITGEGFFTYLNNIFAERRYTTADGQEVAERYNAHKGYVYGCHLESRIHYQRWIAATIGLTWQQSQYSEALEWSEEATPEKRMLRTPDLYGFIRLSSTPWRTLNLNLSGKLTGPMLVPNEGDNPVLVSTPTFFDLDFMISYDFSLRNANKGIAKKKTGIVLQVNAGIQNITNSFQRDLEIGMERDGEYIYGPLLPRSFFGGLKLMFE